MGTGMRIILNFEDEDMKDKLEKHKRYYEKRKEPKICHTAKKYF